MSPKVQRPAVLSDRNQSEALVLLLSTSFSPFQIWLTFAPVADQSAQYLKVSLDAINWLSLVYMVVAIPLSFGTTWMLDTLGLRITVSGILFLSLDRADVCDVSVFLPPQLILGSWLNMLGAMLRLVGQPHAVSDDMRFLVVMLGQTLCALAQPLIIFTPTKVAALWFPDHQRATANMIASMCKRPSY